MRRPLPAAEIDRYRRDGYVAAVDALTPVEAARARAGFEQAEARHGGALRGSLKSKSYLFLPCLDELVRHEAVLDAVESLIGPDLLVLHSATWVKEPGDGAYVSWHQDSTYFNLVPSEHVKVWLALSPSLSESGCLQVIPGSHRDGQRPHLFGERANNLLSQGQYVDVDLAATPPVELPLRPGQFSIHHEHTLHGSAPNRSADRRIGFAISYVPPRVRSTAPARLSAMLVRGTDRFGHFDPEPRVDPADPAPGLAAHAAAMAPFTRARAAAAGG